MHLSQCGIKLLACIHTYIHTYTHTHTRIYIYPKKKEKKKLEDRLHNLRRK